MTIEEALVLIELLKERIKQLESTITLECPNCGYSVDKILK